MTFNVMKSFSLSISWYREPDESTLDSTSEPDSRESESESLSESCSKDFSSEQELDPSESLELELSAEDEGSDS